MKVSAFSSWFPLLGCCLIQQGVNAIDCEDVSDTRRFLRLSPSWSSVRSATLPSDAAGCAPADNMFDVDLIVLSHLYFLMQPTKEAEANGCKPFLVHTTTDPTTKVNSKEAVFLDQGLSELDDLGFSREHGSLLGLGTYSLEKIIAAYNSCSVDAQGFEGVPYNNLYNNCGDFIANYLTALEHVATFQESEAIAILLLLTMEPSVMAEMRATAVGNGHASDVHEMTDFQFMYWLVDMRLYPLYGIVESR